MYILPNSNSMSKKSEGKWWPSLNLRKSIFTQLIREYVCRKVSVATRPATAWVKTESYFLKPTMSHWNISQILGALLKMVSRWLSRLSRLLLNKVVPKAFSVQAPIPALVMTLFAIPYTIVLTVQMRGTQNFVDVSLSILLFLNFTYYSPYFNHSSHFLQT